MLNTVAEANNRAAIGWLPRDIPQGEHSPGGEHVRKAALIRDTPVGTLRSSAVISERGGTSGRAGDSIAQRLIGIQPARAEA